MKDDDLQLARITNDREWQAYRKLFAQENQKRGIKAEPLPEKRPQPNPSTELDLVIDRAVKLWQRDRPIERIKSVFDEIGKQFQEDGQYYYYQACTYLENTLSGVRGIVEDTLNISPSYNNLNYFLDPRDCLDVEPTRQKQSEPESNNLINRIAAKGAEDITAVEQHIFNFCNFFRGR